MNDTIDDACQLVVDVGDENLGLAFGLTAMSGLATALGAVVPFFPCINVSDKRILVVSLGVAAGVMLYVSFVEIFVQKGRGAMECVNPDLFELWSMLLFFLGIASMHVFHVGLHTLKGVSLTDFGAKVMTTLRNGKRKSVDTEEDVTMATSLDELDVESKASEIESHDRVNATAPEPNEAGLNEDDEELEDDAAKTSDHELSSMGIMTAVAIFLHNLPEGLATFVATLADPSLGVAVAIAIAIHNIPEGLCVSMPIYYSSGSRWKAFGIALLSGVSEPFGAFLGWAAGLKSSMTNLAYGVIFTMVGGMMVYISIKELIPTGYRYDPKDKYMSYSIFVGMLVMSLSLVLFSL